MTDDRELLLLYIIIFFGGPLFFVVEMSVPFAKSTAFLYRGCHKSEWNKMDYT